MLAPLLFSVALLGDSSSDPVLPPRPPALVSPAPVYQPPTEYVAPTAPAIPCTQLIGCGGDPGVAVRVTQPDGYVTETSASWDHTAAEADPDYSARLDADLCAARPVFCPKS